MVRWFPCAHDVSSCLGILIEQKQMLLCVSLQAIDLQRWCTSSCPRMGYHLPEPNEIHSTSPRVPFASTPITPKHSTRNIIILQERFRGSNTLHTAPYRLLSHQRRTQPHNPQHILWLIQTRSDARIPEAYQIIAYRGVIAEGWLVRHIPVERQRKGVSG